jgi:radical SAM superfamily enzyme YgiQ (UPF0313 family)
MEPLAFAVLRALTDVRVECELQDEQIEALDLEAPTDLVALTVETYTARRAYEIATAFRERDVPVVMGGHHPTLVPEEALLFADTVVCGDAEGIWPDVVRDAQAGALKPIYQSPVPPPLQGVRPDRSIFRGKPYTRIHPLQIRRGCRFACDFCSIHAFYGSALRRRPWDEVAADLEEIGNAPVFVVDDNLFHDVEETTRALQLLKDARARWICQVSVDIARHENLLDLMAESGCAVALIGFESLHPANLAQMKKRWSLKSGGFEEVVRRFHSRGIMLYGTFVFGYDQDTPESFDATVDFAIRSRFCLANFNPLTPIPGTALFDRLRREGRLLQERWWLDSSFRYGQAQFHPRGMTAQELTEGCFRARKRFNAPWSLARRALDRQANAHSLRNLGLFFLGNRISRKEIYRKQGMKLGSGVHLPADPNPLAEDLAGRWI